MAGRSAAWAGCERHGGADAGWPSKHELPSSPVSAAGDATATVGRAAGRAVGSEAVRRRAAGTPPDGRMEPGVRPSARASVVSLLPTTARRCSGQPSLRPASPSPSSPSFSSSSSPSPSPSSRSRLHRCRHRPHPAAPVPPFALLSNRGPVPLLRQPQFGRLFVRRHWLAVRPRQGSARLASARCLSRYASLCCRVRARLHVARRCDTSAQLLSRRASRLTARPGYTLHHTTAFNLPPLATSQTEEASRHPQALVSASAAAPPP